MKIRPLPIILILLAALCVAAVIQAVVKMARLNSERVRIFNAVRALPRKRVIAACEAFVRAQEASGKPVPSTVPLRDLVFSDGLSEEEIQVLAGVETVVSLHATNMDSVLVRAKSPGKQTTIPWEWEVLKRDGTSTMMPYSTK